MLGCISLYLTQSKSTTDESDEIPLSKSLVSKSKGKARQTQHRKAIQPQDSSDSHEDELPRTSQTLSKGKRSIGAPGSSTATGVRFPKFVKKRPRLASPGGENDTVSQRRYQLRCYQLIAVGRKQFQTSQPAIMTEVSHLCFCQLAIIHSIVASRHTDPQRNWSHSRLSIISIFRTFLSGPYPPCPAYSTGTSNPLDASFFGDQYYRTSKEAPVLQARRRFRS